ncbi:chromosome segregation protein SMC [Fundicoccus sp. Sow4_H7]|uniref:chromosome segregation protein SMC n=1 Tax=Fundicoccus sp. Sow4_H7 TaxID=3438784 RepID=UPI003F93339C
MYLSRIEMTGFKSFADKTVIEFDKGITAVVGPNGSGKSNLSEAIRWVLGEQSAKSLRGSKMEDVIFNGTQQRKAVNLAKVTIVLNNEDRYLDYDFSEISITRSYNRNGESSYFINNESCRLKDIVDLLLDSGLGKNNFSMISQGKVENIFLNKPEERRAIFEEAAGVQKYQVRKQEAERKLNKSADHLSRVKDIIHELSGQLKPLKKQREAALIYQEKQKELSSLEVALYTHQIDRYRVQWHDADAKLLDVNQKIQNNEEQLFETKSSLQIKQNELEDLIQTIDENADHFQKQVQFLEQNKAKQQILSQQISFKTNTNEEKFAHYQTQLKRREDFEEQLIQAQANYKELQENRHAIKEEVKALHTQKELFTEFGKEQADAIRAEMIDWYQKEATAKNQFKQNQNDIEKLVLQIEKMHTNQLNHKTRLEQSEQEKIESEKDLSVKKQHLNEIQAQVKHLTENFQAKREERTTVQRTLFEHERLMNNLSSKLDSLRQMQSDYTGYYSGVRAVMKNAGRLTGIDGTIADLIEVPIDFQVAIDQALGASMQHIVVHDDTAARSAINYLKQNRAGRATFLPRTNIKGRFLNQNYLQIAQQHSGYIGLASELVRYDKQNQAIIQNLLGTTLIMSSIEAAQSLARQLNFQVKIVTLAGEVLLAGGSISGGESKQKNHSMLSRQTELKAVEEQHQNALTTQKQYETQLRTIEENFTELEQKLEQLNYTLNQAQQDLRASEQTLLLQQSEYKQIQQQLMILNVDLMEQENEKERLSSEIKVLESAMEEASQQIEKLNTTLSDYSTNEEERRMKLQSLEQSIQSASTQLAVVEVEERQQKESLTNIEEQLNHLNQEITQYLNASQLDEADVKELNRQLKEIEESIERTNQENTALQETLINLRQDRQKFNLMIRELEQKSDDFTQDNQKLYQQKTSLEAKVEKVKELIDNHLDYLNQEHQLSYEAAVIEAAAIDSVDKVQKTIRQLKTDIEKLGPINIAAIEDFDQLNERYQHLTEQEEDLLLAISQLQATMDQMDKEVIKRFSETFNQINHQFQKTFRKLFGGGEATLKLSDSSNMLTTGVDIIAQPPGKRKQQLALLSGGERAFTAIALLFAILETKPVPFCVLDEVEAALDDANVDRYGQYLQNFTENTQFIVITHRKGTMEHADVLYGVTMQESGISKLASVRLSEAVYE